MKFSKIILSMVFTALFVSCGEEEYYNIGESTGDGINVELSGPVDLGLSVEWASCDLGAHLPYVSGTLYDDDDLFRSLGGAGSICGSEYDPATESLGADWRMPSKQELEELVADCTWIKGVFHNVTGWYITGPSGKTIFMKEDIRWSGDIGRWDSRNYFYVYVLDANYVEMMQCGSMVRNYLIRPVKDKK